MAWQSVLLAFLAGYGLMSLFLWLSWTIWRWSARPWTTSALLLAGEEEARLEGILRGLHDLWERGRLLEILVSVGAERSREIALRLAEALPGLRVLPAGAGLPEAMAAARGMTIWLIDLARVPKGSPGPFRSMPPFAPLRGRQREDRGRI
ncbi:MAG: hypothetical protein K6U03_08430 [Firmicutes bacterium]|nr:hypothetical protein [Bacillota bacterium]